MLASLGLSLPLRRADDNCLSSRQRIEYIWNSRGNATAPRHFHEKITVSFEILKFRAAVYETIVRKLKLGTLKNEFAKRRDMHYIE